MEGYDGRLRAAGAHLVLQKAAQVQSLEDVVAGLARGKAGRVPAEGRPRPGGRPVAERAR